MDALFIVLVLLIAVGLPIYLTVVCLQKGKPGFAVLGWLFGAFHVVGAMRLAKPDSSWARKHYNEGTSKLQRAEARFGKRTTIAAG